LPDQPEDLRGPRIFALLGVPAQERVPDREMDRLATEIGAILVEPPAD
jgi:hypothetical protein